MRSTHESHLVISALIYSSVCSRISLKSSQKADLLLGRLGSIRQDCGDHENFGCLSPSEMLSEG